MDAYEIAYERFVRGKPKMEALLKEERRKVRLAAALREMRESVGISQSELARRIGTTPSAICRLEDPDYEGHSLKTLQRVAAALGLGLELTLTRGTGRKRQSKALALV
jgi:transcriptional regulator with XRE-family HTH domain